MARWEGWRCGECSVYCLGLDLVCPRAFFALSLSRSLALSDPLCKIILTQNNYNWESTSSTLRLEKLSVLAAQALTAENTERRRDMEQAVLNGEVTKKQKTDHDTGATSTSEHASTSTGTASCSSKRNNMEVALPGAAVQFKVQVSVFMFLLHGVIVVVQD